MTIEKNADVIENKQIEKKGNQLRIWLMSEVMNSLTQRVMVILNQNGFLVAEVKLGLKTKDMVELASTWSHGKRDCKPDVIICPLMKTRIPPELYQNILTLVVHPGPPGDRGASALDWCVFLQQPEWGVTVLEAAEDFDAGNVWGYELFKVSKTDTKSSIYRTQVQKSAITSILEALERIKQNKKHGTSFVPKPATEYDFGILRENWKRKMRNINFEIHSAEEIMNICRASESQPGANGELIGFDQLFGFFGPKLETNESLVQEFNNCLPGSVIGTRNDAILVKLKEDNHAIWFSHLKEFPNCKHLKVPANYLINCNNFLDTEICPLLPYGEYPTTFLEIFKWKQNGFVYLHFDFYNGACSTKQLKRLQAAIKEIGRDAAVQTIVLMGGRTYFGNGINLNTIEAAENSSKESWNNINAIDDVILEFSKLTDKCIVTSLARNAGAGGVMMALAADLVLSNKEIILNPAYSGMGLFGSEYWTFFFPERALRNDLNPFEKIRKLEEIREIMLNPKPIGWERAIELRMIDFCEWENSTEQEKEMGHFLHDQYALINDLIEMKTKVRDSQWFARLASHREEELKEMTKCFDSDEYNLQRKKFVYH